MHNTKAMTLVEILVVMVILLILFSILIPVSFNMVSRARLTHCLSNLRNVGMALNSFANDHEGMYPSAFSSTRNPPHLVTWMTAAEMYTGVTEPIMGSPPKPRAVGIFICPELPSEETEKRNVGYFYNARMYADLGGGDKIERSRISPETFLVVEGNPKNGEGLANTEFNNNPPKRHYGHAANFLRVDGSVETVYPPFDEIKRFWYADVMR